MLMLVKDMLNEQHGLIKATKFVGQSQGKQEQDKGFNQKEQKKVGALRGPHLSG
jgi:ATP-dependent DNA helicase MPH1